MSSFEIPTGPVTVTLIAGTGKAPSTGSAEYSITNQSTLPVAGRISVQVTGETKAEWFTIEGEKERNFAPGETQNAKLTIVVPADVKPGEQKFRLRVVAVNDPQGDHMESPITALIVPPPLDTGGGGGFPWWIVFVAVGILAVIIFLVTAFVAPGFLVGPKPTPTPTATVTPTPTPTPTPTVTPTPPPYNIQSVVGDPYDTAATKLNQAGFFTDRRVAPLTQGKAPDSVIGFSGPDPSKKVLLTVDPGVPVPDFYSTTRALAQDRANGIVKIKFCNGHRLPANGLVYRQSVPKGQPAQRNVTEITLYTAATAAEFCNARVYQLDQQFILNAQKTQGYQLLQH